MKIFKFNLFIFITFAIVFSFLEFEGQLKNNTGFPEGLKFAIVALALWVGYITGKENNT